MVAAAGESRRYDQVRQCGDGQDVAKVWVARKRRGFTLPCAQSVTDAVSTPSKRFQQRSQRAWR